jgi:hypothetical protein
MVGPDKTWHSLSIVSGAVHETCMKCYLVVKPIPKMSSKIDMLRLRCPVAY